MKRRFVILDRDGTLIFERHYLSDPRQVELIPTVPESLRALSRKGFGIIVITNQSAIGRGFFDLARLARIHQRLHELLHAHGVRLDGVYFCPHTPDDRCRCRKPQPGLIEVAARELGFEPHESFVIGDKACDIELGKRVGATTFLVRTGYGAQEEREQTACPDFVVDSVWDAVPIIERLHSSDISMAKTEGSHS